MSILIYDPKTTGVPLAAKNGASYTLLSELSQEDNALGRFLKQRGKQDKTQAGKMMSAVGRAQSFAAQQRYRQAVARLVAIV